MISVGIVKNLHKQPADPWWTFRDTNLVGAAVSFTLWRAEGKLNNPLILMVNVLVRSGYLVGINEGFCSATLKVHFTLIVIQSRQHV